MLLADLHIHSTWSDGKLSIPEIVDLFGRTGHDIIAITDHVVNRDNMIGKFTHRMGFSITAETFPAYRAEIEREARRAWDQYRMVVIAGCELTQNRVRHSNSAHVLAIGSDEFISAEGTVEEMLARARRAGALIVACHPNEQSEWFANTFYLWKQRAEVQEHIDLWEVACRWDLFPQVGRARLPYVGNSDFHRPEHLWAWKTLVPPCEKNVDAVLAALRRGSGLAVTRLEPRPTAAPLPMLAPDLPAFATA
jgi:3',5'-nucleoside bisphosphate phosphatase